MKSTAKISFVSVNFSSIEWNRTALWSRLCWWFYPTQVTPRLLFMIQRSLSVRRRRRRRILPFHYFAFKKCSSPWCGSTWFTSTDWTRRSDVSIIWWKTIWTFSIRSTPIPAFNIEKWFIPLSKHRFLLWNFKIKFSLFFSLSLSPSLHSGLQPMFLVNIDKTIFDVHLIYWLENSKTRSVRTRFVGQSVFSCWSLIRWPMWWYALGHSADEDEDNGKKHHIIFIIIVFGLGLFSRSDVKAGMMMKLTKQDEEAAKDLDRPADVIIVVDWSTI